MKPAENTAYNKNETIESSGLSAIFTGKSKASEEHFMFRLQEMEELNAHLEKLIEQNTKKLTEVIATNNKFLSLLAHDLKSPFCSILGVLEILKKSYSDYNINEIEKYIDIAINSANRTLALFDNLLAWAISQNKEKSFNPVKISLHKLIGDEIENINISASQKQIKLHHSIASNLKVTADLHIASLFMMNQPPDLITENV